VPCHSENPTREGFTSAPAGITFDTLAETKSHADAIEQQAVQTHAMPLGNVTGMTDEERDTLGAWINSLQ
jgi:uncharacterized membrane protein